MISNKDTYFDYDCAACSDWLHGALWVNGFNVGRYFQVLAVEADLDNFVPDPDTESSFQNSGS